MEEDWPPTKESQINHILEFRIATKANVTVLARFEIKLNTSLLDRKDQ